MEQARVTPTHFVVYRDEWHRGKGYENSKLLREDGQRCCIGFVGQQCGIPDDKLLNAASVVDTAHYSVGVDSFYLLWPRWLAPLNPANQGDVVRAYEKNDSKLLSDSEREKALIEIFAVHGNTIEFQDSRP